MRLKMWVYQILCEWCYFTFTLNDNTHPQIRRTERTEEAITSLKTVLARTLQSMVPAIEPWLLAFLFLNGTTMMCMSCGFNKTEQHVTQLLPQLIYWRKRHLDHIIPRSWPVNWPPRSCDITPLDYFLWGYVKSLDYADKPETIDYLIKANICSVITDIRPFQSSIPFKKTPIINYKDYIKYQIFFGIKIA